MRSAAVAGVALTAALCGCGPARVPVSAAPQQAGRVLVGPLPPPRPLPDRPAGVSLPERSPQRTEVYLDWEVVGVFPSGRALRLVSHGEPDPAQPGCGSIPVAVHVQETPAEVTVGLVGPLPAPARLCAMSLLVAVVDVPLQAPADGRVLYRWTG